MGIGIAQGFATIGGIGFEGRIDYGAIGTVTNLAARLCGEAHGGEILVSQRVLGAARRRRSRPSRRASSTLKGFHRPVPAFRVRRVNFGTATECKLRWRRSSSESDPRGLEDLP